MSLPRVLLSAYQCGPGLGSVSQIGWEWYSRLAQHTPVTLLTHVRNREALSKAGAPLPGTEVHYIDTEWFAGPLYRFASRLFPTSRHSVFLLSSLDFFVFDHYALKLLRNGLDGRHRFDLVHAVTPVSPVAATRLHQLKLPLVVGPWNGGLSSPATFPEIMSQDSAWIYRIRDLGKLLDRVLGTSRRASLILSATRFTDESIPLRARTTCVRMLENGVDLEMFHPAMGVRPPSLSEPLRIVFVGRLLPMKGVPMLLEAVARVHKEFPVHLTIVGDGPLRTQWEVEARAHRVIEICRFTGNLPLPEVAAAMRAAHVFCLPSVRESGGAVLLEAMASGVPILAVNYGGPAEVIDHAVGRPLSCAGPERLVEDMVSAFRDIVRDPEAWRQRGLVGRRRAEEQYGWDAKINSALELYASVLRSTSVLRNVVPA
jgi:glycosyltransferase involved in cell wall biosynthesis